MYPNLNVARLCERIAGVARLAQAAGARLRQRRIERRAPLHVTDAELQKNAVQLLQVIRWSLDGRMIDRVRHGEDGTHHLDGLTAGEVFRIGRDLGWADGRISALCDILIDDAHLVTHVERRSEGACTVLRRTFEPDGEMMSELVRRLTTQWGLPRGIQVGGF